MNWTPICKLEDIVPTTGVGALIGEQQLAVFRLEDDRVFALDNFDPHSQANVLSRGIVGDLGGVLVVASPIYKQHFRLSDGVCLEAADKSVRAYPVDVVDGVIHIDITQQMGCAA